MESQQQPSATFEFAREIRPRGPQFSVGSLLALMTVVAIVLGTTLMLGEIVLPVLLIVGIALLISTFLAVTVAWGTAAVYSRGSRRTFYGAACFAGTLGAIVLLPLATARMGIVAMLVIQSLLILASLACGYLAVFVRSYIESRGWHLPESPPTAAIPSVKPALRE